MKLIVSMSGPDVISKVKFEAIQLKGQTEQGLDIKKEIPAPSCGWTASLIERVVQIKASKISYGDAYLGLAWIGSTEI